MGDESMRVPGVLVVAHGDVATALVDAARRVARELESVEAVSVGWNEDGDASRERIEQAVAEMRARTGSVLVLTDMFGGAATDVALSLLEPGAVEVVTGVNLPMLVKLASLRREADPKELGIRTAEHGRSAIQSAGDLLEGKS